MVGQRNSMGAFVAMLRLQVIEGGRIQVEDIDKELATEGLSGHVYTNCYCWRNRYLGGEITEKREVDFWYRAGVSGTDAANKKKCMEECGKDCKEKKRSSTVQFTCGDNTQECGQFGPDGFQPRHCAPSRLRDTLYATLRKESNEGERVVAIIADYEDCFDFLSSKWTGSKGGPTSIQYWYDPSHNRRAHASWHGTSHHLLKAIHNITEGNEVILFVGSYRQGGRIDDRLAKRNQNGHALGDDGAFARLAADLNWKLDKSVLSDDYLNWKKDTSLFGYGVAWNNVDSKTDYDYHEANGLDERYKMKTEVVNMDIKRLIEQYGEERPIDVYLFENTAWVASLIRKEVDAPPENVKFHTVWFSWSHYAFGKDEGIVDTIPATRTLKATGLDEVERDLEDFKWK